MTMAKKPAKPVRKSPAKPLSRKPAAKKLAGAHATGVGSRKAASTRNGKPVRKKAAHGNAARHPSVKTKPGKLVAKKKVALKRPESKLKGGKPTPKAKVAVKPL